MVSAFQFPMLFLVPMRAKKAKQCAMFLAMVFARVAMVPDRGINRRTLLDLRLGGQPGDCHKYSKNEIFHGDGVYFQTAICKVTVTGARPMQARRVRDLRRCDPQLPVSSGLPQPHNYLGYNPQKRANHPDRLQCPPHRARG